MAILKNTTYEGSPIFDIDPGSETWKRTLANAQGDLAGCLALLTDNAEADHINHSGAGRGALLGVPWVNQAMGVGLGLDTGGGKNGGVVAGDLYNFSTSSALNPARPRWWSTSPSPTCSRGSTLGCACRRRPTWPPPSATPWNFPRRHPRRRVGDI